MATVLTGLTLVPMDGPPERPTGTIRPGAIRIEGDRIDAVGDAVEQADDAIVDASGLTAVPGFVQAHVHFCQTLFRGLADGLRLLDWLQTKIWPLEAAHDEFSVRASAELSIYELLTGGATTVQAMESVHCAEESFDVAARSGMTTILGNCLMDVEDADMPPGLVTTAADAMRISGELCAAFNGKGRLTYAISPRFILSCSETLCRDAAALATEHGLRVHTHAAEHPDEIAAVRERTGRPYVLALRDLGLLGPRTGLAHCVHLEPAEQDAIAETGSSVLHCPTTNLKLGSGIARISELDARGIRIGLGSDGAPCNNRLSAMTEMRQAALLQAVRFGPDSWPAERALCAATAGGAAALGLGNELGSIEPGKRADLVLFDLEHPRLEPGGDPVSKIVYTATEADIRQVWLGGKLAVERGNPVDFDGFEIARRARLARDAVLERAGLSA